MDAYDEKIRAAIADQAGEWYVANDDGPLDLRSASALAAWIKTSPVHVEELLGVADVARDLALARGAPGYSLQEILARARLEEESSIRLFGPARDAAGIEAGLMADGGTDRAKGQTRWHGAGIAIAACLLLTVGVLWRGNWRSAGPAAVDEPVTVLSFATRHGDQLTHRLADNSVLHLNSDSAVSIRYSARERLVTLQSGQAAFEVAHEAGRSFRVLAGPAEVVDLGTRFDVQRDGNATVVTVLEGRVAVGRAEPQAAGAPQPKVQLRAEQQIRVGVGEWPSVPVVVDAQRTVAWLHRQITFDHEPLEKVAREYNRYSAKPIEIESPRLRTLQISGVFATDDTEAFVAFLRSLKGVRVEVTASRIVVSSQ